MEIPQRKALGAEQAAKQFLNEFHRAQEYFHYGPDEITLPSKYSEWADTIRNMIVRDDDVWVISFPRSGTTWMQEMVWLLMNDLDFEGAKTKCLDERFPFLELDALTPTNKKLSTVESVAQMDVSKPRLIKTHLPPSLLPNDLFKSNAKIIYVARNPKDACVSYYHLYGLFGGYAGSLDQFCEDFLANNIRYAPYWASVNGFFGLRKNPNILFLTYESMKQNLQTTIQDVAAFLGKALDSDALSTLQEHLSFEQMQQNNSVNKTSRIMAVRRLSKDLMDVPITSNYLRKGKVGSWKEEMSAEIIQKFDSWIVENGPPGLY